MPLHAWACTSHHIPLQTWGISQGISSRSEMLCLRYSLTKKSLDKYACWGASYSSYGLRIRIRVFVRCFWWGIYSWWRIRKRNRAERKVCRSMPSDTGLCRFNIASTILLALFSNARIILKIMPANLQKPTWHALYSTKLFAWHIVCKSCMTSAWVIYTPGGDYI